MIIIMENRTEFKTAEVTRRHKKSLAPGVWGKQHGDAAALVEAIGENGWERLWLVSAYMKKKKTASDSQGAAVTHAPYAGNQPLGNVRNADASHAASSISTPAENVKPKFSLPPSTEVRASQIAADRAAIAAAGQEQNQQPRQPRMGERQFTTQTLQNSPAVPDWVKRELYGNDYARFYEVETNRQQLESAWTRIQQEGYDAAVNRLTYLDHIANAVEEQELNIMMALARHYSLCSQLHSCSH